MSRKEKRNLHSFLIISKNKNKALEKVSLLLKEEGIGSLDMAFLTFEKSVGIEDVRKIQETIYLKALGERKAIIIEASVGITTQAQNALLKMLEEPPKNTIIVLTANSKEDLLPTILSRCKIYEIFETLEEDTDFQKEIKKIIEASEGERLVIAQHYSKDRETALLFSQNVVLQTSQILRTDGQNLNSYLKVLREFNKAYSSIKNTNVNPRFILEITLLNL